jgi:hypothetical protein
VVLRNRSASALSLAGWLLGDAGQPGGGEALFALPEEIELDAGALFVVARKGAAFVAAYGRAPAVELEETDAAIPNLVRRRDLAGGSWALADGGDEVVLVTPSGELADAVVINNGGLAGVQGSVASRTGETLQRAPGADGGLAIDLRHQFFSAPAEPFAVATAPSPAAHPALSLDDGYTALWGSLTGASTFGDGVLPPHMLLAVAAARGLDFVVIGDPQQTALPLVEPSGIRYLRGWRMSSDREAPVVVSDVLPAGWDASALAAYFTATGAPVVASSLPAVGVPWAALPSSGKLLPGGETAWNKAWHAAGMALLPGGASAPDAPATGASWTGLAASSSEPAALRDALAAHRGWLTSAPGLWLTLRAETPDGVMAWMGETVAPANRLRLHLYAGDRAGQPVGVTLWQDGKPLAVFDRPPADGRIAVDITPLPGSVLFAVAAQVDGDYALTAPLWVQTAGTKPRVVINEVVPAPRRDLNADGVDDQYDEFIELYNPGSEPVSLGGWQLSDDRGDGDPARRHTFKAGTLILGGGYLLLWKKQSRLSLADSGDWVRLLDPAGVEVDRVRWPGTWPTHVAWARIPDGESGGITAALTPGAANQAQPFGPVDVAGNPYVPPPPTPRPAPTQDTTGQAGGAPGTVAQSKLYGLKAQVEFRARVTVPPGLLADTIYVADVTGDGVTAGIGLHVYLRRGEFPLLAEGDLVWVRGILATHRGETELQVARPEDIWPVAAGLLPLAPLPVTPAQVTESLEGRLVRFTGIVTGYQGDSIFLADPLSPETAAVRVTVRSSLGWKRPYVLPGQRWQVTGIVSQFAQTAPWNGGYRVLVRYPEDLLRLRER